MSHLTLETLARLVDEDPLDDEMAHLEACASCRENLVALQDQSAALAGLPDPKPPAALWTAIEGRLLDEGIVGSHRPGLRISGGWLATAAAITLFVLGGAVGSLVTQRVQDVGATGRMAAGRGRSAGASQFATRSVSADPTNAVRQAEAAYLRALAGYAEQYGPMQGSDPVSRLAALESIVLTTRAALEKAPADPVINGYHLTAVAQREAMLRELAAAPDTTWF